MENMKYDAFISYRHLPLDKAVASQLQKLLEGYKPPRGGTYQNTNKITRLFRDESELPTSNDLGGDIRSALEQSRYLIVIISPKLKESKWCMQEIEYFKELHGGRTNQILPILVEGGPEAFPDVLRYDTQTITLEDGSRQSVPVEVEPLASNIIASTEAETLKKLKVEFLRIAAPLLGCAFDDLYGRQQRRARHRVVTAATVVMAVAAIFVSTVLVQNMRIQKQRDIADRNAQEARENADEADRQRVMAEDNADEADRQRVKAEENADEADRQRAKAEENADEADRQRVKAEDNADEANKQRTKAEDNAAEADRQRVKAEDNADEADRQRAKAEDNAAEAKRQEGIAKDNEAEARRQEGIAIDNERVATARGNEIAARQAKIYSDFSLGLMQEQNLAGAAYLALRAYDFDSSSPETLTALNGSVNWRTSLVSSVPSAFKPLGSIPIPSTESNKNYHLYFSADGSAFTFADGSFVRTYDTKTMKLLAEHFGFPESHAGVFEQPADGGNLLVVSSHALSQSTDKSKILVPGVTPFIIDSKTGEKLYTGKLTAEMLTEFGLPFCFYANAGSTRIDAVTGTTEPVDRNYERAMTVESFSKDGVYTALKIGAPDARSDYYIDIHNNITGESIRFSSDRTWARYCFFSPDSKYVVVVGDATNVLLIDGGRTGDVWQITVYSLEQRKQVADFIITGTQPKPWEDAGNDAKMRLGLYSSMYIPDLNNSELDITLISYSLNSGFFADNLFSPDGSKMLIPYSNNELLTSADGVIRKDTSMFVLDLKSGSITDLMLPEKGEVRSVSWNADGSGVYYVFRKDTSDYYRLFSKTLSGNLTSESLIIGEGACIYIAPNGQTALLHILSEEPNANDSLQIMTLATEEFLQAQTRSASRTDYQRTVFQEEMSEIERVCNQNGFEYKESFLPLYTQHKIGSNGTRMFHSTASALIMYDVPNSKELFMLALGYNVGFTNQFPQKDVMIAISEKADRLVYGQGEKITIYNATTGEVIKELPMNGSQMKTLAVSPDGKRVAALSDKGTLFVFNAESGAMLTQHSLDFLDMKQPAFTPDGKYLYDEETRALFDAGTGAFIVAFLEPPLPNSSQPQGGQIVWLDDVYTLRIPPAAELVSSARSVVREYGFTPEERRMYYLD